MPKFAFVFPGQGSQAVGMLNGFADNAVVQETVAEASEALGFDLGKLIAEGPKEELDLTTNTQPVMLTASVAFYRAWIAAGGAVPEVIAGHSLGEFSALVAAGVIPFRDAVNLVRFRAKAMQEAVPVGIGGMAAIIGLGSEALKEACQEAAQNEVSNRPTSIRRPRSLLPGHKTALARACDAAKGQRCQTCPDAAGVSSLPFLPAETGFRSSGRIYGRSDVLCAANPVDQQCGCRDIG